jgi:HTH-type transcriptional regulator, sugar sensing transcriptional regulator
VRHDIAMHLIADKLAPADFESFWASEPALLRLRADHGAPAALLRRESKASASTRRKPS